MSQSQDNSYDVVAIDRERLQRSVMVCRVTEGATGKAPAETGTTRYVAVQTTVPRYLSFGQDGARSSPGTNKLPSGQA